MSANEKTFWFALALVHAAALTGIYIWVRSQKLPPLQKIAEMAERCMVEEKHLEGKPVRAVFASNDMKIDITRAGTPKTGSTCIRISFKRRSHKLTLEFQGEKLVVLWYRGVGYFPGGATTSGTKKQKTRTTVKQLSGQDCAAIDRILFGLALNASPMLASTA